ncbi:MAG: response regulator [Planctomycetes bacterium]|nr:response regulator [Planctomycetota bacterium]
MATSVLERSAALPRTSRDLIVFVDDESHVLSAFQRLVRQEPYELATTESPEQALQWVRDRDVSLLITDQRMPGMAGTRLLELVHECSPHTKCVMLTAFPDSQTIFQRMTRTIHRLITKPWNDEELKGVVRHLLRQRRESKGAEDHPFPEAFPGAGDVLASRDLKELVVRVDGAGHDGGHVLSAIREAMRRPEARRAGLLLVLDHVMQVRDSLIKLLNGIAEQVASAGARVALLDPSGAAFALRKAWGSDFPLAVFGPEPGRHRPKRILVIEGHEETRAIMRTLVATAGHFCETASDAEEGERRIQANAFDLALMDLDVLGVRGVDIVLRLAQRERKVPIVALSHLSSHWDAAACARLGIRRRLSKPCSVHELFDSIREL